MNLHNFKKLSALLIILFISYNYTFAQTKNNNHKQLEGKGIISGKIIDSDDSKPIGYATVYIYKMANLKKPFTGGVTKADGSFNIDKIGNGTYHIVIKFMGYSNYIIDSLLISNSKYEVNLGTIKLKANAVLTNGIEVTAKKDELTYNIDKKVYNVADDISSVGGTLSDAMQNIPSVSVDADGNVSLRGNANVNVLIDGKPSTIMGYDKSTVMDQIPASTVDKIEIITNPSAKYDPEGVSGIINIVLKKENKVGYNGLFSLNAGTHDRYNASANLNYREGNLNMYLNYDNHFMRGHRTSDITRNSTSDAGSLTSLDQLDLGYNKGFHHSVRTGLDYDFGDKNNLTFAGTYRYFNFSGHDSTAYNYYNSQSIRTNENILFSDNTSHNNSVDLSLGYKKEFENKNHQLTANAFYSINDRVSNYDYNQDLFAYDSLSNTFNSIDSINLQHAWTGNINRTIALQSDYSHPLNNDMSLDFGYKSTFKTYDIDYNYKNFNDSSLEWNINTAYTNHFIYHENVHAVYAIFGQKAGLISYQAGLRFEAANTNSEQKTLDKNYTKNYLSWFPSAHIKYEFNELQSLLLSFSRRINRPNYNSVNPFVDNSDPQNLKYGNPFLKPEYTNALELGHSIMFDKMSINSTIFYRHTSDMISRITTLQADGTSVTTYNNINNGNAYGIEGVFQENYIKWWRLTGTLSFFKTELEQIDITKSENPESWSWTARIISNFVFTKAFSLQVNLNYRSPVVTSGISGDRGPMSFGGYGKTEKFFTTDVSIRYDLLDGDLSFSLRGRDIFKSMKMAQTITGENFKYQTNVIMESQSFSLGVTYRINDYKRQQQQNSQEEEYDMQ